MSDTRWGFTAPQEGEVNSAKFAASRIMEVDQAILTPAQLVQLTSGGEPGLTVRFGSDEDGNAVDRDVDGGDWQEDEYLNGLLGRRVMVTNLHYHPVPRRVPMADDSAHSSESDHSKASDEAARLSRKVLVNGHEFDGSDGFDIEWDDFPESRRVYYGTMPPNAVSFPRKLRPGDLYVRYSETTPESGEVDVIGPEYEIDAIDDPTIRSTFDQGVE